MDKIIFFTIFVVFPFGQLFKIGSPFWGGQINIFDILVLILGVITLFQKPKFPNWYRYFIYFVSACFFSLLINYQLVNLKSIFYLIRLISYSLIPVFISNHINENNKYYKKLLGGIEIENKLLWLSIISAIFGFIQYFIWPDLTALKYLGWDDHLLRMVGTFLDPTFLALVLLLGIVLAIKHKNTKTLVFLAISLAFTYSRISYLIFGLILLFVKFDYKLKIKTALIFTLIILLLPKNIGEGTTLTRTASGNQKLINYTETIKLFKESPVLGVGFNNICSARRLFLNDTYKDSHSCNGADSSILFILATTGIIGLMLFVSFLTRITASKYLVMSFVVVLLHSFFSNSLFYPHIMFWLFSLLGLQTEVDDK